MTDDIRSRRSVLAAGGAAAGVAALSACGAQAPQQSDSQPPAPPQPAPSGQVLTPLAAVPVGGAIPVQTPDGRQAIVARPDESTAAAFDAACTHKGCPVKPAGAELTCPCHGSVFDAATGAVRKGPADRPLASIPVRVQGDQVVTA
ncbi:Rieske (2Fe-2S) protein [Saccharopolyspora flava]|uniref:Cytochrome bc1 complex Rieske iron-sulfur subunit n=1 Tax=Saccharopolyspora flava TaxID=95161 RepID=A0A1I6SLC1_9PSEU|nr:Rieske (2Fe-2S) protein [Saccharopolyspora flava]SFS77746.1 Ferredoxin subunit of nitrite reductase or a ring-hydroxylating dioxygenase [Saccharopolyspora flava]